MTKKAKGGLTKGKSHKEGGIPMKVKSTGQNIEVEGGEIIINKYSSADTKLHDFDGKKMTKCEVASAINSADNNGVKIDCDTIVGRKYKYEEGGRIPLQNSLGIERQYLPQVRKKDYPEFFEMLSKDNISFQETTIDPLEYNPTQSYVKKDNIDEIYKANKLKDKPLLVSSDGFVLDGHHRWYYATQEKMPSVKAIIINLPIYELIEKVNLFRMAEHQYKKGGKIDKKKYVSFFADTDGDGIPNVDDISPFNRDKRGQIEEVRVSDELEQIIDFRNKAEDVRFDTIEKLEKIAGTCGVGKDRCGILSRTKTPYSIINKMRRRSLTNTKDLEKLDMKAQELLQTGELSGLDLYKGLTDVVGTMVVVDTYDQLDRVSKEIERGKIGKVLEYENFYDLPNGNNGYRAIHFIIGVKKDGILIPVEVQIKTKRVKKLAEASHTAYKNGNLDNAKNDELGVMVMKADKGDEAIAKEIDPLIADTKKLKKELTMEKRKKGGLLDEYLAKGGLYKTSNTINKFGMLSFSDLDRAFGVDLFELSEDEQEEELDGLREDWQNMEEEERMSILEDLGYDEDFAKGGMIDYSKEGFVKAIRDINGKIVKEVVIDGVKYRRNPTYKTYNSVKDNQLLHKSKYAKGGEVSMSEKLKMVEAEAIKIDPNPRNDKEAERVYKIAYKRVMGEDFEKGGKVKAKREINEGLKELEEALAGASKKHKAQSKMVGQIQKGFDETFEEGGKVDVVDERSVGKMKIIVMNDGKSSRTITFKDGVQNQFNRNKQEDIDKLWELSSKVPFGTIVDKNYKFAKGGDIRYFDRYADMPSETRLKILKYIDYVMTSPNIDGGYLTNSLYGLYDGYDYSQTSNFIEELKKIKKADPKFHNDIMELYQEVQTYPETRMPNQSVEEDFEEGGMVSEAKAKEYFGYTDKEFNDLSEYEKKRTRKQVFRTIQEDLVQKKRAKFIKKRDKELYMDFNDYLAKGGKIKGRPTLKQMCDMYRNKR